MAEMRVTTLKALGAGSVFTYGGIRWIVLEQSGAAALVLAADLLPDEMPFDEEERNDWAVSTLRQYLNGEFFKQLVEAGADADAFNEMVVDLTSDDGLDDYGTDSCKIALISDAQYRRFRRIIPNVNNWWWTITPFSTAQNGYSRSARRVSPPGGALDNGNARYGSTGARPLCNLNSSIAVSFDPDEAKKPCENERSDADKRAEALDMMRHIVAAWDFKPEELAGIFPAADEAEPETVEPPEVVKAFMRDVLGMPEETVQAARARKMPDGGFGIEIEAVEAETTAASVNDLRAEFEDFIARAATRFDRCEGVGFNPECFTAIANAYGMAIAAAKEGGE